MTREEELTRQGRKKQSTNDGSRLSEMVETYQEIGYEIHLEPFQPELEPDCTDCMKMQAEKYKTIYTRKKSDSNKSQPTQSSKKINSTALSSTPIIVTYT